MLLDFVHALHADLDIPQEINTKDKTVVEINSKTLTTSLQQLRVKSIYTFLRVFQIKLSQESGPFLK
jgi:hypothetical protein